jgi:light-regulated signal transduction histidine kinase (bacteriophytochrome)
MESHAEEAPEEELKRTREAFRQFVSRAIHDLREPLRAISASSELLTGIYGDGADERAAGCFRYMREGVDRMELLLRDIAEYSYAEGRELQSAEVDMNRVLEEARRQASVELQRTEAQLTSDALPVVEGDFFALAGAFRNLIENACRFRSTAAPSIHVGCIRKGSEWLFSVRDNGLGFKPAYADAIFQPFMRLHGRQYPGSGLGLPRTKRIIEQHGGRIWVDSAPAEGSTFWFSLPVTA